MRFGLSGADLEAAVRVGAPPPVAALQVLKRRAVGQLGAKGGGRLDAGDSRGGAIEHDDPAVAVRDDYAVGEFVVVDAENFLSGGSGGSPLLRGDGPRSGVAVA